MNPFEITYDYCVTDDRHQTDPESAEAYFASSDQDEAIRAANESRFNFLVIRTSDGLIVHDGGLHTELPLES